GSVGRRPTEPLGLRADPLLLEPPLPRRCARLRRDALPLYPQRLAQRLDEPLDRALAVPPLAPLVLRDGAQNRPGLREHAPLLRRRERRRGLDVEHRFDSRFRLLRVLTAGAARA